MKPDLISADKPSRLSGRWAIAIAALAALIAGGILVHYALRFRGAAVSESSAPETATLASRTVAALGYLRPDGEVLHLSAPTTPTPMGSNRIQELRVQEGDLVQAGQIIAVLDSQLPLQSALSVALEQVKVAQAELARVQAGSATGDIESQQATIASLEADLQGQVAAQNQAIARLEAELNNAQVEHQRHLELFNNGAITASLLDSKQLSMTMVQEQLNEARANRSRIETTLQQQIRAAQATLNRIREVRPTDVQAAQAGVDRAIAEARQAQTNLETAYIRAPLDGQVLEIYARPGELIGDRGVIALGQTEQMNVIAEVYELDVGRVEVGQLATITSRAFPGELRGTVERVGLQVNPQGVLSTDPTADVNRRIVEVKIQLNENSSQQVSGFTNLQVQVLIDVDSGSPPEGV